MKVIHILYITAIGLSLAACSSEGVEFDASGSFEAVERIISAEATGKIIRLDIEEGQILDSARVIGQIDVSLLRLQSEQIRSSMEAIGQKQNEAWPQVRILEAQLKAQMDQLASLEQQLAVLDKEIGRFRNLVASEAAPEKQLDDLEGQRSVLLKKVDAARSQSGVIREQISSAKSTTAIHNRAILSELEPTRKRLAVLEKQIRDGLIVNEHRGTVITKYAWDGEYTAIGKPVYKIADLSTIILRAYITGNQLPAVSLGDRVKVFTDDGQGGFLETEGLVEWISSKAEFTPKTIQTKDERENLVYAMKVRVKNDGTYKIGMYGEIKFMHDE